MKYEEIAPVEKEQAEKAFGRNVSEEIVHALLGVTWHVADWEWVQDRCLGFLDSPMPDVRNTAIICLGHLARIHKQLNRPKVLAALASKLADPQCAGRAEDAMEDIEMFAKQGARHARNTMPQPKSIDFDAFSNRFGTETDRACGVLGAAYLDAILEDLFRYRLTAMQDDLLGQSGPLGSFNSRIKVAFSLSWINADTYADLITIKSIRNDFAHSFNHELHFGDPSIADRCRNLRTSSEFLKGFSECAKKNPNLAPEAFDAMRDALATPRWRFQLAVETIGQLLGDLPPIENSTYAGPDVLKEAYALSANLRPPFVSGLGEVK